MSSWYEKDDGHAAAGRDTAKWIWGGVAVMVALMLLALLFMRSPETDISQVQVRHILLRVDGADPAERQRSLDLALKLKEQLAAGASFEDLARKYSGDPGSAPRGGYLGWNPRGTFSEAFDEAAWTLPIGEISDVVQTNFGFHLIQVLDRKIARSEAYDAELDRKARELNRSAPAAETPPAGSE